MSGAAVLRRRGRGGGAAGLTALAALPAGQLSTLPLCPPASPLSPCSCRSDIVPLGQLKSSFNYSTTDKRVLNAEHIVNDDDNIKQDVSQATRLPPALLTALLCLKGQLRWQPGKGALPVVSCLFLGHVCTQPRRRPCLPALTSHSFPPPLPPLLSPADVHRRLQQEG